MPLQAQLFKVSPLDLFSNGTQILSKKLSEGEGEGEKEREREGEREAERRGRETQSVSGIPLWFLLQTLVLLSFLPR